MASHYSDKQVMAYRVYASNCLKMITGCPITYYDMIHGKSEPTINDTRSGDEIALDVIKKCGLKLSDTKGSEEIENECI